MKIPSFDAGRTIELLLAITGAAIAATCAAQGTLSPHVEPSSNPARASMSASAPPSAAAASGKSAPAPNAASVKPDPLSRFHALLAALEKKQQKAPVRILFFGDSHTASDHLTGSLRRELARRYGVGGPGYLVLGNKAARHTAAKVDVYGKFRVEPDVPALGSRQSDGVFGLAGLRATPHGALEWTSATPHPNTLRGQARWEIAYRLPEGASFRLTLGKNPPEHIGPKTESSGSTIRHIVREAPSDAKLEIGKASGAPQLFGASVESSEPGVVVDMLGINGARVATALAWDEPTFEAEVALRRPALVAIAYGTNEAFDARPPNRLEERIKELISRLRKGAPDADCLVVGPPDAPGDDNGSRGRVREVESIEERAAADVGCAFFSERAAMGGDGSYSRWAKESPPLAAPDGIHLTTRGYEELGRQIAKAIAP